MNKYIGNIPAISDKERIVLSQKHVLVAGCGSIGAFVIEFLTRAGVGKITVADNDVIREIHWNSNPLVTNYTIGDTKLKAAENRIKSINKDVEFITFPSKIRQSTIATAVAGKDLVIDTLDRVHESRLLQDVCSVGNKVLIYGRAAGWKANVMTVTPASGSLERYFSNNFVLMSWKRTEFVAAYCASIICAEAVKSITGKQPGLANKMLYADLSEMSFNILAPEVKHIERGSVCIFLSKSIQSREIKVQIPQNTSLAELRSNSQADSESITLLNGEYVDPETYHDVILEEGDTVSFKVNVIAGKRQRQ